MKKIISLILTALMVLSVFASCGKKSGGGSTSSSSTITESSNTASSKPSSSSKTDTPSAGSSTTSSATTDTSSATSSATNSATTDTSSATSSATNSATTGSSATPSEEESDTSGLVDTGGVTQDTVTATKKTDSGFSYEDYEEVDSDYNRNLFYYNERLFEVADPSVIWVSKEQSPEFGGYFYAYGTSDQLGCHGLQGWRSKDMTNWEDLGPVYRPDHMNNWARTNFWAPEIIYDEVGQSINGTVYHYFMFYNADLYSTVVNNTSGVGGLLNATTNPSFESSCRRYMGVVYSNSPAGPFIAPENVTNLDGKTLTHSEPPFDFSRNNSLITSTYRCNNTIDASPFIDSDGTKYMYYSGYGADADGGQCIYGVKMKDWLTPDYSTVTMICQRGYKTVGGASISEGGLNEGPTVIKKDGVYYMTFSTYGYTDENYQVRLATSSSPLSGFVKVDPNNGGTVIKTESTWTVKSVGHHQFVQVGDQLFIAYHTFLDGVSIASGRALNIDECKFIDYNGQKVIVTNGPTKSYQPLPYAVSGYKNIVSEATVNVTASAGVDGGSVSDLTDGLVKYHANNNYTSDYLGKGKVKVTIEFSSYKSIRALMVYLPFDVKYRFQGLKDVVITYNGGTVNIDNVAFDLDAHVNLTTTQLKVPGGAAILEFADLPIKKIEFTLTNTKTSSGGTNGYVGMSEIVVLSDPTGSTAKVTDVNKTYTYLNAEVPAIEKHDQGKVLGSVNVDGTIYHTTYGFADIATEDDGSVGSIVKNSWTNDQYAFFKGVNSPTVYFEGKLNVYESGAYLNDYYPKLGLVLKNYSACTFFYIDASNNYTNKVVGYTQSKIGGGDWDWNGTETLSSCYTAGKINYKGGENWVKLAIARIGDAVYMYCDDILIFSTTGLRGLGTGTQAACGFLAFNTGYRIKDYSVITGSAAVEAKIADLSAKTDEYISSQTGGTSGQFGDVSTDRKSATTWDTSKDYSTVHPNYSARQLTLSSTDGSGNRLYYKEVTNTLYYMEATFKATGLTKDDEAYSKFGFWITDYYGATEAGTTGADKNGVYFYVDAQSSYGVVTGTSVGLAKVENGGRQYNALTKSGVYTQGEEITLGVFRQGLRFVFFVNGTEVFSYDSSITGKANPAFQSDNMGLIVTNYRLTTSKTDAIISQYYVDETDENNLTTVAFGKISDNNGWTETGFTTKTTGGATNTTAGETVTYANVSGTTLYFEAEISLPGNIYNNDGYPKAGLIVKSNGCDLFFAIDALPNGNSGNPYFGGNNWVGFGARTTNNGVRTAEFTFCDTAWGKVGFREVKGMTYNSSGSAKMQVLYEEGTLYLAVNDSIVYVLSAGSITGLTGGVSVGVMAFNLNVVVAGAKAATEASVIANMKKNLGIVDETLGVTIDGDLTDWTKNNTTYSYWDSSDTPLGFEVMAAMGDTGVFVGMHAVVPNLNGAQNDWWLNTNTEMWVYSSTDADNNDAKTQVYLNIINQAALVGAYSIKTKANGSVYDVYFEMQIPYAQIGYTGQEDYVAIFFAIRPGTPSGAADDVDSNGWNWWAGSVHAANQTYNSALTTYKVTKEGIVIV